MASKSKVPFYVKAANVMTRTLLRAGVKLVGAKKYPMFLLTVQGRKSGEPRTTPVAVVEFGGERYLMAPYGTVDWVRNLRAAGVGVLSRGRSTDRFSAVEVEGGEAGPVIKDVVKSGISIGSYFGLSADAPVEEYEKLVDKHPVFRLKSEAAG